MDVSKAPISDLYLIYTNLLFSVMLFTPSLNPSHLASASAPCGRPVPAPPHPPRHARRPPRDTSPTALSFPLSAMTPSPSTAASRRHRSLLSSTPIQIHRGVTEQTMVATDRTEREAPLPVDATPTSNQTSPPLHGPAARRSPWTPPSSTKSSASCRRRRPATIVDTSTAVRCASSSSPLASPPSHHPAFLSSSLSRLCWLVVCSQGGGTGHRSLMCPNRNYVNNHCRRPVLQSPPSLRPVLDQECFPSHLIADRRGSDKVAFVIPVRATTGLSRLYSSA
jgi:hypothetical protein